MDHGDLAYLDTAVGVNAPIPAIALERYRTLLYAHGLQSHGQGGPSLEQLLERHRTVCWLIRRVVETHGEVIAPGDLKHGHFLQARNALLSMRLPAAVCTAKLNALAWLYDLALEEPHSRVQHDCLTP